MFFFINDMIVPGSTYWNMVFGYAPGEAIDDDEGMETNSSIRVQRSHFN